MVEKGGEITIALQGTLRRTMAKSSSLTFCISIDTILSVANSTEIALSLYGQLAGSIVGIESDVDSLKTQMDALEKIRS